MYAVTCAATGDALSLGVSREEAELNAIENGANRLIISGGPYSETFWLSAAYPNTRIIFTDGGDPIPKVGGFEFVVVTAKGKTPVELAGFAADFAEILRTKTERTLMLLSVMAGSTLLRLFERQMSEFDTVTITAGDPVDLTMIAQKLETGLDITHVVAQLSGP